MGPPICPHCSVSLPPEEIAGGWCETCGKRLPVSFLAPRPPRGGGLRAVAHPRWGSSVSCSGWPCSVGSALLGFLHPESQGGPGPALAVGINRAFGPLAMPVLEVLIGGFFFSLGIYSLILWLRGKLPRR
jgi:hypothetical protein